MEYFAWAENNLDVATPHQLQDRGVQVYFAPNIPDDEKLVDLEDGNVTMYHHGEERPIVGYYAQYDSLRRYVERNRHRFYETEGLVVVA